MAVTLSCIKSDQHLYALKADFDTDPTACKKSHQCIWSEHLSQSCVHATQVLGLDPGLREIFTATTATVYPGGKAELRESIVHWSTKKYQQASFQERSQHATSGWQKHPHYQDIVQGLSALSGKTTSHAQLLVRPSLCMI